MENNYDSVIICRVDDAICIGDHIRIQVLSVNGKQVRLGTDAPRSIEVHRKEIYDRKQAERLRGVFGARRGEA